MDRSECPRSRDLGPARLQIPLANKGSLYAGEGRHWRRRVVPWPHQSGRAGALARVVGGTRLLRLCLAYFFQRRFPLSKQRGTTGYRG